MQANRASQMETSAIEEAFELVTTMMPATTSMRATMPKKNPARERRYAPNEYARSGRSSAGNDVDAGS